jgi:cellulose synthase/poly-beta-1,6-N-acetylglucosamine synthase-like glycosyltransferase
MATTKQAALNKIKSSKIRLIDGNTDAINECMRRHLRKLEKVATSKSKKNNAKVAAHPAKLAFVIFFDNGSKVTRRA